MDGPKSKSKCVKSMYDVNYSTPENRWNGENSYQNTVQRAHMGCLCMTSALRCYFEGWIKRAKKKETQGTELITLTRPNWSNIWY